MKRSILVLFTVVVTGCTGGVGATGSGSEAALTLAPADEARLLEFVNYPGTDEALLDVEVGLDQRAAHNIIVARNGADGVAPSADDQPFASLAALDAVSYVGDSALSKLASYSAAHPAPAGETVETVVFAGWQSQAVVWGVNQASLAELDALLDSRAANGLVAKRPFSTVAAMGPVPYVGAGALGALRANAGAWWSAMRGTPSLAGTFDGVAFDEATAQVALEIANQATLSQMTQHGMPSAPSSAIIGNRPYTTVAQIAAVGDVGTATMTALRAYAQSGTWGAPADMCINDFDGAVGPELPQLLFLSESDRPLDLVAYPGAGAQAPTAASFFALLNEGADWSYESRDPSNFYIDLEPASPDGDNGAAAAVQAAFAAQLTGVIYVAVHKPANDPYQAEVDVYLIGRTACGDLVGIHSISVET